MTENTAVPLQPGRELDKLVARHVMGYCFDPGLSDEDTGFWYPPEWSETYKGWPSVQFYENGQPQPESSLQFVPHFSTDPPAAMRVWEKLPTPRRLHETEVGIVVMCGGRSLGPDTDFIHDAIAMGGTIAHAICLVALKVTRKTT